MVVYFTVPTGERTGMLRRFLKLISGSMLPGSYDGASDTATIYFNGQVDGGPQAQRAPNGGGTFIFGGRNNGEIAYNGYVDDVTIWRGSSS